jgi:hypothetical protein
MSAPQRLVDDPAADELLRDTLRGAPAARRLDDVTRRRLSAKVARASAVPVLAAGWLFVKSAAAALGVVVGTASIATYTGALDWPSRPAVATPAAKPRIAPRVPPVTPVELPQAPEVAAPVAEPKLDPRPSLPVAGAPLASGASLSAESLLLEQARREMRRAPAVALQIAAEHAQRFPRGQLTSERTLIQIEALHRSGRDGEARALANRVLGGASGGLYAERIRKLLGEQASP